MASVRILAYIWLAQKRGSRNAPSPLTRSQVLKGCSSHSYLVCKVSFKNCIQCTPLKWLDYPDLKKIQKLKKPECNAYH